MPLTFFANNIYVAPIKNTMIIGLYANTPFKGANHILINFGFFQYEKVSFS